MNTKIMVNFVSGTEINNMLTNFIQVIGGLDDYMLPCLNKKLFGTECPGCGIQRSVSLLVQGEFKAAFFMYPAIYTLIFLFIFLGINNFIKIKHSNKIIIFLAITNVGIILANYILKLIN